MRQEAKEETADASGNGEDLTGDARSAQLNPARDRGLGGRRCKSDQRAVARPLLFRRRPPRALQRDQPGLRDASRLARLNQDWHRLLGLCAITSTLVIDEDGCYNQAEFNDGLVLGMNGTFAQAELHIIRARLHGGKLNKAAKGELRFPAGRICFRGRQDRPRSRSGGPRRSPYGLRFVCTREYSIRRRPTLQ
jgi:hypothetical protein